MQTLLLGLAALALGLAGLNSLATANAAKLLRRGMAMAGAVALALAALLLFRGSLVLALLLAIAGLWLISGPTMLPHSWGTGHPPTRTSRVATEHLEMELDLDSGDLHGRILKGFFAGRRIETLRPVELAHLWQDCRFIDPPSADLIEAYLDRLHPSWREDMARAEAETPRGTDGRMTRAEALDILGLSGQPEPDVIRRAHRELILKLHPDRGGSTYLAAKVNEAKDVLLDDPA
jgi:hypothetical protein